MAKQNKRTEQIQGVVQHLNYSKNGDPNGAVLDTGHFVHIKRRAAQAVGLRVGQTLKVEGKLKTSRSGGQRVIEAASVNGIDVASKRATKKTAPAAKAVKRIPATATPARKTRGKKTAQKRTRRAAR